MTATYPREARRAAHHAARAVLAHGIDSPDTATAIRRLETSLSRHPDLEAEGDSAGVLVAELAEAASAITTEDHRRELTANPHWLRHHAVDVDDPF